MHTLRRSTQSACTDLSMTKFQIKWLRIGALLLFFVTAWGIAWRSGIADKLNKQDLRDMVLSAGHWGTLLFFFLFGVGNIIQIPGLVFVAGAILIYGYPVGTMMSFAGGLIAVSMSFWVARGIGGDPLARLKNKRAHRIIDKLKERPVRTMALLRIFMQMSPALNVALALSGVRFRDYLMGALLTMWAPILVMATAVQFFLD